MGTRWPNWALALCLLGCGHSPGQALVPGSSLPAGQGVHPGGKQFPSSVLSKEHPNSVLIEVVDQRRRLYNEGVEYQASFDLGRFSTDPRAVDKCHWSRQGIWPRGQGPIVLDWDPRCPSSAVQAEILIRPSAMVAQEFFNTTVFVFKGVPIQATVRVF